MLKVCTEQDYERYAEFAYTLATDQSKSGYPTYSDGIKTKEMFFERSLKAFSRDTEEILLFEHEGTVKGWIHYYYLPSDQYLSTVSCNISSHTGEALQEFLEFAQEKFKGYDLLFGYSKDNQDAIRFLSTHGFQRIEESYNNTAFLREMAPFAVSDDIIHITKDNYEYFRLLHSKVEENMYWNSDRIYTDMDHWVILAKIHKGEAVGSVYFTTVGNDWFEIFGIDMKDGCWNPSIFRELLEGALNAAQKRGGKYLTFFCNEEEQNMVSELGFTCVGEYVCYQKRLI